MNSNIEKILSLSAGALLFGIALAVFFSAYDGHLDYINSSMKAFEKDIMVEVSREGPESYITGSEVIHRIIEFKTDKEILELQNLYSSGPVIPYKTMPEIWIDGKNAESFDHTVVDPAEYYHVSYDTDPHGNIIRINYSLR